MEITDFAEGYARVYNDCTCNDLYCVYKVNKWSNAVDSNVRYILLTQSKVIMQLDDNEKQKEMSLLKRRFVVLDGGWSFMSVKSMGRIIEWNELSIMEWGVDNVYVFKDKR